MLETSGPAKAEPLCAGVKDAAAMLGISSRVFFDLISQGEIETIKIGRRRLVLVESMHRYVDRLRAAERQRAS